MKRRNSVVGTFVGLVMSGSLAAAPAAHADTNLPIAFTGGIGVYPRVSTDMASAHAGSAIPERAMVSIVCETTGKPVTNVYGETTNIWDKQANGSWISNAYLNTGVSGRTPGIRDCGATAPPPTAKQYRGSIGVNTWLGPNDRVVSHSGRNVLVMQSDGNLVAYFDGRATWASGSSYGHPGSGVILQSDSNLVVHQGARALWASNTVGRQAVTLAVQDDGNVVLYTTAGRAVWATNTYRGTPGPVPAPSTTKSSRAVTWALNHVGSDDYPALCERFVENAYGTQGRYGSAVAARNALAAAGQIHMSTSGIPAGALVFSRSSWDSGYGHVVIAVGNGTYVSGGIWTGYNGLRGGGHTVQLINSWNPASGATFLGWAYAPSSWAGV